MFTRDDSEAPVRNGRAILVLVVLAAAALAVSIMQTMLIPLIPELPHTLGVSADSASWLVTATVLAGAVALPTISRLADMFGKRRMILVCLLLLLIGSLLGVFASGLPLLITARALQGCAIAVVPVAMSILRDELPAERLPISVAFISAIMGVGGAISLPLTGVVFNVWGWHAVFWLAGAMAVVGGIAVRLAVPESKERTGGHFDFLGAVLLSGALLGLLLGITQGNGWGWLSAKTLGTFVAAAVLFALWTPWELRARQPLVDLRTSARRPVLLTNIAALLTGVAMFSNMLATTQQMQMPTSTGYGLGLTVLGTGIAFLPIGLVFILFVPLAASITRRHGPQVTLVLGGLVMCIGFFARLGLMSSLFQVVLGASLVSLGMTLSFAALPVLIMRHVPVHETAAANGLNTLARTAGLALGTAVITAVLVSDTTVVDGVALPSESAFLITFVLGALVSLVATGVALAIPRGASFAGGTLKAPADSSALAEQPL